MCKLNNEIDLISISTQTPTNSIELRKKFNFDSFSVVADFNKWDKQTYIPGEVIVKLDKIKPTEFYHLSLCSFCKKSKTFEIHVEKVEELNFPQNHLLSYKEGKNEDFIFLPLDHLHFYQVNILIYNTDPAAPDYVYKKCGIDGDPLTHPPQTIQPTISGPQPKTKKGNIIVGNP